MRYVADIRDDLVLIADTRTAGSSLYLRHNLVNVKAKGISKDGSLKVVSSDIVDSLCGLLGVDSDYPFYLRSF